MKALIMSPDRPTDPTLIVAAPVSFFAQPAKFSPASPSISGNSGSENGLVERRVIASSPVAVEYQFTPLGRTLQVPFKALDAWTLENTETVERARSAFDRRG
jgi:hypothetical protein